MNTPNRGETFFAVVAFLIAVAFVCFLILGLDEVEADRLSLQFEHDGKNLCGFIVERGVDETTFAPITTMNPAPAGAVRYQDYTVTLNARYCYRVKAFNYHGSSAYSNTACGTVTDTATAPTLPASQIPAPAIAPCAGIAP